jgi:hypothetical protein
MKYNIEEIKELIAGYAEKHPLAVKCGSEYVWQEDDAQVDAIQLVADIFDSMESEDN